MTTKPAANARWGTTARITDINGGLALSSSPNRITGRIAATWYTVSTYTIDLNFTDGAAHQMAVYCVDWDNFGGGRTQILSILDGTTGATLDTRSISSFENGVWLVWTLSGHVKLQVTNTNGAGNAVISALMFDVAATTPSSGPSWSQSFTYDGFSNLTNVNAVNAPGLGVNVNPANNQLLSDAYDANGNDISIGSYDAQNRLSTAAGTTYGYDSSGERVYKRLSNGTEEFYFWAPNGQRLGTYTLSGNAFQVVSTNVYFGGRLLQQQYYTTGNPWFAPLVDRLGSNVSNGKRYFPYGGEKPSATTNEIEKFTGYFRDSETGLDYAVNRFYQPGMGRFSSADPSQPQGNGDPQGWNRYAYAGGDPINRVDPHGTDWCTAYDTIIDDCNETAEQCAAFAGLAWMNVGGWEQLCGSSGVQPVAPPGMGIVITAPGPPADVMQETTSLLNEGWISGWSWDWGGGGSVKLTFPGGNSMLPGAAAAGCLVVPEVCIGGGAITVGAAGLAALTAVLVNVYATTPARTPAASQTLGGTQNQATNWSPCTPPVGTIAYRYDSVPPGRPHYPFAGDHVHLYIMNQNPVTGGCYWNKYKVTEPPPPPGAIPFPGGASGGVNP